MNINQEDIAKLRPINVSTTYVNNIRDNLAEAIYVNHLGRPEDVAVNIKTPFKQREEDN